MEVLHIPVTLQKLDKGGNVTSKRHRSHIGTTYFEAGTTVNDVLTFISERQRRSTGGTGLWLLQTATDPDNCSTIKDSKHRLEDDGTRYLAVYYSGGPDIFIQ